jgi:hypothetical protein
MTPVANCLGKESGQEDLTAEGDERDEVMEVGSASTSSARTEFSDRPEPVEGLIRLGAHGGYFLKGEEM